MKKTSAFTLVELLTVIAIIGILAAILIPVVSSVRSRARATTCSSNMRQVGTAMLLYSQETKPRHFPYAYLQELPGGGIAQPWAFTLAPYLGLENTIGWNPKPRVAGVLTCPEWTYDSAAGTSAYAYNPNISPKNGSIYGKPIWNYSAFIERPSRLFLLVEIDMQAEFYYPSMNGYDVKRRHPRNGANFVFADGHVETVNTAVPYDLTGATGDPRWIYSLN